MTAQPRTRRALVPNMKVVQKQNIGCCVEAGFKSACGDDGFGKGRNLQALLREGDQKL